MGIRAARPATVVGAIALALLGVASPAAAAQPASPAAAQTAARAEAATSTPPPTAEALDPLIRYEGTAVVTDTTNPAVGSNSFPTAATFDCSSKPCLFQVAITSDSGVAIIAGPNPHPVDGPTGSFLAGASGGGACSSTGIGSGTLTYTATATTLELTREGPGFAETKCPDGSTVDGDAFSITLTAMLTSGDSCILVGGCPTPTPTGTAAPVAAARHSPPTFTTPSTLSVLPTVATAVNPANIVWATAMTVVLVLLIALPTHLLNTAAEQGTERFREWWAKRRPERATPAKTSKPANPRGQDDPPPVDLARWPLAAAGVIAATFISSFVSPTFGFNAGSVRIFLSILVSFALDAVAGWFILIWLVRRTNPGTRATFTFAPASLLIVVAAVVFTRLTGFQPGIVFGLVAGVAFGAILATSAKAKITLIGLGYSFVVAVIGWVGYSIIDATAGSQLGGGMLFVRETLSSVAIAGIAALPIALVPLRGLAGYDIYKWNRLVWAAGYAVGLFGFFVVLMPKPLAWDTVPLSIWVWVSIYLAYALVAVGAWLGIAKPWKRANENYTTGT